jgi:hypothetical protein
MFSTYNEQLFLGDILAYQGIAKCQDAAKIYAAAGHGITNLKY